MKWRIAFSKDSLNFLNKNNLKQIFIIDKIKLALHKFKGEGININIKNSRGNGQGFIEFVLVN